MIAVLVAALLAQAPALPPLPPEGLMINGHKLQVFERQDDKGRVLFVVGKADKGTVGVGDAKEVLAFVDARGRPVKVYADHPVDRVVADRLLSEARARR